MADTFDAIYQAVRSKLTNGDIGSAIESAISNQNWTHYVQMAFSGIAEQFSEYSRPSTVHRPKLFVDGNQWCALLGENLQCGVAGFGESPEGAFAAFDRAWYAKLPPKKSTP